jgi:lysophospholipase L1-like esterase
MTYWYLAALLILIVIGVTLYIWLPILSATRITREMEKTAAPYERRVEYPTERILIAGDSTAFGLGTANNADSIAGRIGKDFPDADIENIGVVGLRLSGLTEMLAARKDEKYLLLVLQIGANDITGRTSYSDIRNELSEVLTFADGVAEHVIVMTAGNVGASPVFRFPFSAYITERTRAVRNIFIEETSKHSKARYVDLFVERKDEPFNKDIPRYYAPDRFHPSGDGYGVWYEKLRPLLPL